MEKIEIELYALDKNKVVIICADKEILPIIEKLTELRCDLKEGEIN